MRRKPEPSFGLRNSKRLRVDGPPKYVSNPFYDHAEAGDLRAPRRRLASFAISSRARSAVVEMPWTLSLNSSTFDAQRSASSSVTNPC